MLIQDVKDKALKPSFGPNDMLRNDQGNDETANLEITGAKNLGIYDGEGTHELIQTTEAEEDYPQLLRRYLHRQRPVFPRLRLEEYYYPDLMNSTPRDGDQVIMRQFSEDQKCLRLQDDRKYLQLLAKKKNLESDEWTPKATIWQRVLKRFFKHSRAKKLADVEIKLCAIEQLSYVDENSPVLIVDQLWLWIIDEGIFAISWQF